MDKRKLVNIILKDLEEVRVLSEEVADSQEDSLIEIELALSRARLLIQEIELLRELAGGAAAVPYGFQEVKKVAKEEDDEEDQVEEDLGAVTYPEPELEIMNYEEGEFPGNEELEEEEDEDFLEEEDEDDELEEADTEEDELEEKVVIGELTENEVEEAKNEDTEDQEDNIEEDDWDEEKNEEPGEEIEEEIVKPVFDEVKPQPADKIQNTVLKSGPQEGIREIHIDDLDDEEEIRPIRVSPTAANNARPPMREIPKPEDAIVENQEKMILGEKFHKERTLNETLGENKTMDSKIAHGNIPSLKAAIGLNDRFLFIREIFNNNSAKYNEVIDRLDTMEQIQEAVEYLRANLAMQKNEASMKFVELLKRRFTK